MNSKNIKNFLIWGGVFFVFLLGSHLIPFSVQKNTYAPIAYSEFLQGIKEHRFTEMIMSGPEVEGRTREGQVVSTYAPERGILLSAALEKGIIVRAKPQEAESPTFWQIVLPWVPFLILIGISVLSMRQLQSGNNKALGFGRSRARLLAAGQSTVTFKDVAGIDEAKDELQEIVDFLKDPKKFEKLGGRIPKGVLLIGPPGTGKTLLARAIAGEAGVPYFSISGSDFVEMFVGVGASRVRDMFEQAKKTAPCIVFIDEIDAVGRHRGVGMGGGNDEREQTLNQLLVEMDGFEESQGIILVAATNRPDILDPALLRPGRFDRQVVVPNPDVTGREKILEVHGKKIPMNSDVDIRTIARGTPGFSGADLANLINEAALMAARHNRKTVTMHDLEHAKDKVMMGAERRSLVMSDQEKKLTAYHEGGHALIAFYLPDSDPIHKATIIPRGQALGMVMRLPENDRISVSRAKLLADLKVAMGGRIAEELIFGKDYITTGASSDISMATQLARHMVTQWGMSEKMGFQAYEESSGSGYLKGVYATSKPISEFTAQAVDTEIRVILDTCYAEVYTLMQKKIDKLHIIAEALLEHETLSGEGIRSLIENGRIPSKPNPAKRPTRKRASTPDIPPVLGELPDSPSI